MTKQEALQELMDLSIDYGTRMAEEIERLDEAVDMAIAALRADTVDRPTCEDAVSRQAAIDAVLRAEALVRAYGYRYAADAVRELPAVQPQPEWNNHTVACLLAELFGDACACNFNGIDEWLPEKCEVIDACPNPVGVACWEQFLKHRAERRTDGRD